MYKAPNARFWTWWRGGWVKLTLRPGQSLELAYASTDSEGWHRHRERYEHCGGTVTCETADEGADCDGRYAEYADHEAHLWDLRDRNMERDDAPENAGIFAPAWHERHRSQRDYAAEAMGY